MNGLKQKRLALDLTRAAVARKVGVSTSGYAAWENGNREPEPGYYGKIALALGLTPDEVVKIIASIPKPQQATAAK